MHFGSAKVIAFTSGKGGVGKTLLTSEVALSLSSRGKRVMIIDGDTGLANIDIFFSVKARGHLYQVVAGDKNLTEIITPVAPRIDLISTGNGIRSLNNLNSLERRGLISSLIDLQYAYDFVLVDTSSGLSEFTFQLASLSDLVVNILTPDPSSFTDSYSLIKLMNQDFKLDRFLIITNMVQSELNGVNLFKRFAEVSGRFLILSLDHLGSVTSDLDVAKFTQNQKLAIRHAPSSSHALQVTKITENILLQTRKISEVSHFWTELTGVA